MTTELKAPGVQRDEREVNLPKWAQQKLGVLRMRLEEAEETLTERGGNPTRVKVDAYSHTPLYVPDQTPIKFNLDQGDVMMKLQREGDDDLYLDINSNGGILVVAPRAANSARVMLLPR